MVRAESKFVNVGRLRNTSSFFIFFHILKIYIGTGVLGLPFAFKEGAFFPSFLMLIVLSLICFHTVFLLVRVKHAIGDPMIVSYVDLARNFFGLPGAIAVAIQLFILQFGSCSVYMVFISQNLTFLPLFREYFMEDGIWRVLTLFWLPLILLLANIRTLKRLASLSIAGIMLSLTGMGLTLAASLFSFIQLYSLNSADELVQLTPFWNLSTPLGPAVTFGIIMFSNAASPNVVPLETVIKRKESFWWVFLFAMVFVSILYLAFGIIGYLGFSNLTQQFIVLNLFCMSGEKRALGVFSAERFACICGDGSRFSNFSAGLHHFWYVNALIVLSCFILAIIFTYPVQLFVVTDMLEDFVFTNGILSTNHVRWKQFCIRSSLVIGTICVAIFIPQFTLIMGLVGSFSASSLTFIFPALFSFAQFPNDPLPLRILYMFEILLGLIGGFIGSFVNLIDLADYYLELKKTC